MRINKGIGIITAAAFVLPALLVSASAAQTDAAVQAGQLNKKDYEFLVNAARGGMEEVQLGQLAVQKGTTQGVRDFGQRMVKDHGKANDELKQLASQKGAAVPATVSRKERSTLDHLQNVSGADFDKAYSQDMLRDHKHDVKEFEKAAKELTDPDLRAWAAKTLPTLQQHLGMAEQLEANAKHEK